MKKEKTEANNMYEALRDNPEAIIKWCEAEIKEYQKLIQLIKNNQ